MKDYLEFAKALALESGEIMQKHFMGDLGITYKDNQSRVTVADLAINDLVIERVKQNFPTHSVRGEEKSNQRAGDRYVWVCDPIDGTFPYSAGLALGMFSLALVKDGVPIIAVIYEPITGRLYSAEKGKGATLNDQSIHVSDKGLVSGTRIDVCDTVNKSLADLRAVGTKLFEDGIKLSSLRSSVVIGGMVADGSLAAMLTYTPHPHDIAAIKLIVEEAGGRVTDLFGNDQRYDQEIKGAILSNGVVHDELVALIAQTT